MLTDFTNNIVVGLTKVGELLVAWLNDHAINIIAILIGAWLIRHFGAEVFSRILRKTIRSDLYPTAVDRDKRIKTLNSLVGASTRVAVYIIVVILIVGEINPQYTTALFASAGLFGVAIGFGAQSLIKDFMNGIFIIIENQYRVGDVVSIGEVSGTVENITIRTTVLRDLNGYVHHVPNGTITVTTNKTAGFRGINEELAVPSDTDLARLEHIINHVGEELAAVPEYTHKILEAPHFARVMRFEGGNVVIKVLGKTTSASHLEIKSELFKRLQKAFHTNHIELAALPAAPPVASKKKR